jgi:hypothetical protein
MTLFTVIANLLLIVVIYINNKVVFTVKNVIHALLEITQENVLTLKFISPLTCLCRHIGCASIAPSYPQPWRQTGLGVQNRVPVFGIKKDVFQRIW